MNNSDNWTNVAVAWYSSAVVRKSTSYDDAIAVFLDFVTSNLEQHALLQHPRWMYSLINILAYYIFVSSCHFSMFGIHKLLPVGYSLLNMAAVTDTITCLERIGILTGVCACACVAGVEAVKPLISK